MASASRGSSGKQALNQMSSASLGPAGPSTLGKVGQLVGQSSGGLLNSLGVPGVASVAGQVGQQAGDQLQTLATGGNVRDNQRAEAAEGYRADERDFLMQQGAQLNAKQALTAVSNLDKGYQQVGAKAQVHSQLDEKRQSLVAASEIKQAEIEAARVQAELAKHEGTAKNDVAKQVASAQIEAARVARELEEMKQRAARAQQTSSEFAEMDQQNRATFNEIVRKHEVARMAELQQDLESGQNKEFCKFIEADAQEQIKVYIKEMEGRTRDTKVNRELEELMQQRAEQRKRLQDQLAGEIEQQKLMFMKQNHKKDIERLVKRNVEDQEVEDSNFDYDVTFRKSELEQKRQRNTITRSNEFKKEHMLLLEDTKAALGLGSEDMRKENSKGFWYSVSNMFFFIVVLACEIDSYGFILSCTHYGRIAVAEDDYLIIGALVVGPLSFMCAIAAYAAKVAETADGHEEDKRQEGVLPDAEKNDVQFIRSFNDLLVEVPKEPFRLSMYHYVPIYRCYMLVKEQVPDDVEALFRINGLSTFTLGFCQFMCLLITTIEGYEVSSAKDDLILKIILWNQGFNFFVTMMYFGTSIAGRMKSLTKVAAMKYNLRQTMQRDVLRYDNAMGQKALFKEDPRKAPSGERAGTTTEKTCSYFHRVVEEQIKELAQMKEIDLSIFSMDEKLALRKQLRIKQINSFIEATAV